MSGLDYLIILCDNEIKRAQTTTISTFTLLEVKVGDIVNHRIYGMLAITSFSESGKTAFGLDALGRERAFTPTTEYLITDQEQIRLTLTTTKRRARQIVRKYLGDQVFQTFAEYLKATYYDLRVETSNAEQFEHDYKQRLNRDVTLPNSCIQSNKWGTQIRLRFVIPSDLSLIPFQEAAAGSGGSKLKTHEVWINKGNNIGEITNWWFNWDLRELGLLFNFENQKEITSANHN